MCPESWAQISSNETVTAGDRKIFYEASLQRDSFLIVFMEAERMHTKKDKYLPKRKTITVKAPTAFYILGKAMA